MNHSTKRPASVSGAAALSGQINVPGDKSISHRALILSALAIGRTKITGLLESEDVLATAQALRELGAGVEKLGDDWFVTGCGIGGLRQPQSDLCHTGHGRCGGVVAVC